MGAEEAVAPVGEASARAEVEATVGQLLQAHGFYAPLELLLMTNRLGYDDYRAWRRGDRETLDQLLPDGVSVTSSFLEEAHTWARGLHLEAASVPMVGTDGCAGVDLKASDDKRLDQLLHTEYRRDVDREQPDMFLDGAQTEAQTDLVDALAARDAATAQARLRRLADLDAAHWAITHARVLIEALQAPGLRHRHEALNRLDVLEHRWLPAASALLRAGARDFLSPLWRDIGRALEGVPFDPDLPNHHPSWAYLNGLDWQNLRRSVHDVASWESEPTLQVRLAQAEWRMRDRRAAMAIWFGLCWQAPADFAECIESQGFPDATLQQAWNLAQDQNLDPPITPPWFPAWMLIAQPGIARSTRARGGTSGPERAFDHLLALRHGHSDREDLDRRRALKNLHPDLLGLYLDTIGE